MKKKIIIIFLALISIFGLNSCEKNIFGIYKKTTIEGFVTDTLGEPIENVKLQVIKLKEIVVNVPVYVDTMQPTYTDQNGFYQFNYNKISGVTLLVPTHNEYVYVGDYPNISEGIEIDTINITMIKKGKVKIEGDVRYLRPDLTYYWMEDVKISVLKRPVGNTEYPEPTGVETYSDNEGKFYIEYEGDENYEFYIKPEKEGYYYESGNNNLKDCGSIRNSDPGYIIGYSIEMEKEE